MPSQDMVLGCYYLTLTNIRNLLGSNHYFANFEDVILAYNQNQLELHSSNLGTLFFRIRLNRSNIVKVQKLIFRW